MNRGISILLIIGIIILVNLLSKQFFYRLDVTENNEYTLSPATKKTLKELTDPVTVQAYFSEDMPTDFEKIRNDFRDILVEYNTISKGNIDYSFTNPNASPEGEQEAAQAGIQPLMINVRDKDQSTQKRAYMGAVLSFGDQTEVIPFVSQETGMEYELTTAIKKMTATDKPSIALVQGHGEPGLSQIGQVAQALSIIFSIENLDLSAEAGIPDRYRAVMLINPTDSIPPDQYAKLDDYLSRGGKVVTAVNAVKGDFTTVQGTATPNSTLSWLAQKGINIEPAFIVDERSGAVTVQQQQGFFRTNTQVKFPFLPMVNAFPEHPATNGLEQVIFQFASPITYAGDPSNTFTPIVQSSNRSGKINAPVYFDIQKKWTASDFPMSNLNIGGVLEGNVNGSTASKLIVFSDGDFPIGEAGRGINPDNANLLTNTIEWLGDDTGLSNLRNKAVLSRPIEEIEDGKRTFLKWMNFLLPIALVLGYGVFRSQRNRHIRNKRALERFV